MKGVILEGITYIYNNSLKKTQITLFLRLGSISNLGFFPSSDEIDNRYSSTSGLKYVDYENFSDIRKQLNYNENLPVYSPSKQYKPTQQFYQQLQRPITSLNHANTIRKRPNFPYQFASPSTNYNSEYPSDLSNSINQNYANYYHYTSQSPSSPSGNYEYYYNPTRYSSPSTSANLYGHHALHQQSQQQQHYPPNYYTNNYANQYEYQRPSAAAASSPGLSNFFNNIRETNSPVARPLNQQLSQVGTQLSKALDDISINDDLQCVPKLICKMIRNPRKPNQLPSFLNVPGITA